MYVCLCNGYREAELREVAGEGFSVAEEVYTALGNGPCCGQCLDVAQCIIDDACRARAAGSEGPSA
jgi:bacterioferritin-associated ferredoxin